MNKQKVILLSLASLISLLCISLFITQAFSFPLYDPVVITFDSSTETQATAATIHGLYPNAVIMKYSDIGSILNILTLERSHSQLILIGHGSKQGILSANRGIIPWANIAHWVNSLPNTEVYFISCDSYAVTRLVNKPSIGFQGAIDGPMAADLIAIRDHLSHNINMNTNNAFTNLLNRVTGLQTGTTTPQYMMITCFSLSTLQSSSQVVASQTITPDCGTPPPSPPPSYVVTFTEAGLPSGTQWSVYINGATHYSTGTSLSVTVPEGTYSYSISSSGYDVSPSSGTGTVSVYSNTGVNTVNFYTVDHGSCPNGLAGHHYFYDCIGRNTFSVGMVELIVILITIFFPAVIGLVGLSLLEDAGTILVFQSIILNGIIAGSGLGAVLAQLFIILVQFMDGNYSGLGELMSLIIDVIVDGGIIAELGALWLAQQPWWMQIVDEGLFATAEGADVAADVAEAGTGILEAAMIAGVVLMGTVIGEMLTYLNNPNND